MNISAEINTKIRFIPALVIILASVYIWGGIALDPEGVEYILSGVTLSESFILFGNYYLAGVVCVILGLILWSGSGLKETIKQGKNRKLVILLAVMSLLTCPVSWILTGLQGILLSFLLAVQYFFGFLGIVLFSSSLSSIFHDKIKLPKFQDKNRSNLFLILTGLVYFMLTAVVGKVVLGSVPHVGDGVIQLFQSKMYAMGRVSVPVPDNIEFFFDTFLAVRYGQWFSQYPPGYALIMVPGVLIGHPELINPLLTGITVILFGLILREFNLSRSWAILFIISPFIIFMSGSFMSHPATMFWGALGFYAFVKSKREIPSWLIIWGLCAGFMFITRPLTALCFNLPMVFMVVRKRIGMGLLLAGIAAVIGSIPYLLINKATTGSLFIAGYQAAWDGASGLFFNRPQWGPVHTPQLGFLHLFNMVRGLNTMLYEVPVPALMGVGFWLIYKTKKDWKEWTLFSAGVLSFAGYYFYFYNDMVYGPRFAYTAALPLLIITAIGLRSFYRHLRDRGISRKPCNFSFIAGFFILAIIWIVVSLPARIGLYQDRYRDIDNNFIDFVKKNNIHNAIVFLDDYPSTDRHAKLFSLGFTNRQAWFYSWRLSDEAVNNALSGLGINPDDAYGKVVPLDKLGMSLNKFWGNPRYSPNPAEDMIKPHIPLKQGLIYMNPLIEQNDIIYARNLGKHNLKLSQVYPEREIFLISIDKKGLKLQKVEYRADK